MNKKVRCDLVRAMEMLVRAVNDEDYIEEWLINGVADGDIHPDTTDESDHLRLVVKTGFSVMRQTVQYAVRSYTQSLLRLRQTGLMQSST